MTEYRRTIMKRRKWFALPLAAVLALNLTACGGQETVENAKMYGEGADSAFETKDMQLETCIMAVGEEEVSLNEMLFYVYQLKASYDGSMTSEVWNYNYKDGENIGDYSKEELIKEIAQIKVICQEAKNQGYALTEEEANGATVEADTFVKELPEDAKEYHLTKKLVEKIYKEHALAKKMYDVVGGTIDTKVSDEEVADAKDPDAEKERILAEREKKAFEDAYKEWKSSYEIIVSETLLDEIKMDR